MSQWHPQAYNHLLQKDYANAVSIYGQAIIDEPDTITHYFYLGLLQLLQAQETEAQFTWMSCITETASTAQIDVCTTELVEILYTEVQRQICISEHDTAWLICQHIHEIDHDNLDNSLTLTLLCIKQQTLDSENAVFIELIETLTEAGLSESIVQFNHDLLWELLRSLLKYPTYPLLIEFTKACLPFVQDSHKFIYILINASVDLAYLTHQSNLAIDLLEICLCVVPNHLEVLEHLSAIYQKIGEYNKGVDTANLCCELAVNLVDKLYPYSLLLRALLNKGSTWQEVLSTFSNLQFLLAKLIEENPSDISALLVHRLYNANYFDTYLRDQPILFRPLQNQIAQLCQANTKIDLSSQIHKFRQRDLSTSRKLRIGYIGHTMAKHSVGWLVRWLISYHDREQFQLYGYFQFYRKFPDDLQSWYESQMDGVYRSGVDGDAHDDVINRIQQDQIDILIDLDSITLDLTCRVMARKPAPIQVSWLGWDASGIPTIDYFIADPYVLPDSAQEYYSEKIWRLPQTYIAVDGFEVGVPSLRRDQLAIPADAVVYLSAQRGYKRHIDTMRLQMQIIKSVPNSYFLIKGIGDQESIKEIFTQMAISEGVDPNCLRFLSITATEDVHRANLGIADIVLDTYPYNGATTTLETLWMCIPLVTRVGAQFAARNSYTMMMNAGISEGIAWSAAEYVEWGVRLGKDKALRQDIAARLRASRQTAPLWNGENFTREMENAYKQMWEIYVKGV